MKKLFKLNLTVDGTKFTRMYFIAHTTWEVLKQGKEFDNFGGLWSVPEGIPISKNSIELLSRLGIEVIDLT